MTCCGRFFQIQSAAIAKAQAPTVDTRVRRITSDDDEAERSRTARDPLTIVPYILYASVNHKNLQNHVSMDYGGVQTLAAAINFRQQKSHLNKLAVNVKGQGQAHPFLFGLQNQARYLTT